MRHVLVCGIVRVSNVRTEDYRMRDDTRLEGAGGEVELEARYEGAEPRITKPFDPRSVDIVTQPMNVSNLIDRMKYDEIDLQPDFQRSKDLWDVTKQSRLIESLIIRIPLPTFYFDIIDDDHWIVVDGLQRLSSIQRFAVTKELRLSGLEYLTDFEGKGYDDIPSQIARRIREAPINAYLIKGDTPRTVRTSIFTRINTGGVTLTPAEIRNSVYRGPVSDLLRDLAHSEEFVAAVRGKVSPLRMLDREFVNRFLAFYVLGIDSYADNLDEFLTAVLERLVREDSRALERYGDAFLTSMRRSHELFGDIAFRKINQDKRYGAINKPLFECTSVALARLSGEEYDELFARRGLFLEKYNLLLRNEEFFGVITSGTAKSNSVRKRHEMLQETIGEVISK